MTPTDRLVVQVNYQAVAVSPAPFRRFVAIAAAAAAERKASSGTSTSRSVASFVPAPAGCRRTRLLAVTHPAGQATHASPGVRSRWPRESGTSQSCVDPVHGSNRLGRGCLPRNARGAPSAPRGWTSPARREPASERVPCARRPRPAAAFTCVRDDGRPEVQAPASEVDAGSDDLYLCSARPTSASSPTPTLTPASNPAAASAPDAPGGRRPQWRAPVLACADGGGG